MTGSGFQRREVYFLRFRPRNMELLDDEESSLEMSFFQQLLDVAEVIPSVLIMDKTEGLENVRQQYAQLKQERPEMSFVHDEVLRRLDGMEGESEGVERAFYLVCRVRNREEFRRLYQQAQEQLTVHLAQREELIVLLRNFLLREYSTIPLATWDKEIQLKYDQTQQEARGRRKLPAELADFEKMETLRALLPNRLHFDSRYVEQNGFFRKTVSVRSYPASLSEDCVLRELGTMPGITVRLYFEPIKPGAVNRLFEKQINYKNSSAQSARKHSERIRNNTEEEQIVDAFQESLRRAERMFFVTILIEAYGKDQEQLNERLDRVRSALGAYGFTMDELQWEQREGFLSMLPYGINHSDTFKRNMTSRTVAALYPFTASRRVDPEGYPIGRTTAGSPVIWDNWHFTDDVTNGHIIVTGNSGQGKSYLLKKILSMSMARGIQTFCLDSEAEYRTLFRGCGGINLNCSGGRIKINPFELRRYARATDEFEEGDPEEFRDGSALMQHLSWLAAFHRLLLPSLSERLHTVLGLLIQAHYASFGIDDSFNIDTAKPEDYPTYTTLYQFIDDAYDHFEERQHGDIYKILNRNDLKEVLLALRGVYDGVESRIFNGYTNVSKGNAVNFDIQALMEGAPTVRDAVLFNVLAYVWNRAVTRGERLLFLLDEAHLLLNPIVVPRLANMVRRGRKYSCSLMLATPNLKDFNDPQLVHLTQPLFAIPAHKFLFCPGDDNRAAMKELLGLSNSEMKFISKSHKRHCLMKCGNEKYPLVVGTMDYEAKLFGAAGGV